MSDTPSVDARDPAEVVTGMVGRVLELAGTWPGWDGRPRPVDDRVYTPHKAIRRVADHLVDHLAEIEARLAGVPTIPDHWHASAITTPADLAPFTAGDLDEARSRLTRLAQIYQVRLRRLSDAELDRRDGAAWSVRQIAFHLEESLYYATAVGDLAAAAAEPGLLLGVVVEMRPGAEADGVRYEDEVLALLARHGGHLDRRLRGTDDATEVQIIRFASRAGLDTFLADPDRRALRERVGDAAPEARVVQAREIPAG
ncbi:hypothetical protein AB0M20_10130 [Actinoplanes sp. NPDC051633]|uniref:hypothetical protein n=1 Tax=Actinoplanes sp. NPDC051633 TaxID=3155670 RepID=UPI003422AE9F